MPFRRRVRVGDLLQREISQIIERELKDPRIGFLTITKVDLSVDLRSARVYYSVLGNEDEKGRSAEGLRSAKGFIKKLLGQRTRLKYLPDIEFVFDDSLAREEHLESILEELKDDEANSRDQEEE
ncbi:hypothetical protein AMJ40_01560 [candidate division TA06 bacterium DG_26]|uniref:Ribosome-binding factor A n=1 Tax=candidate division TA06 bacterium DG_26 TaxID=1703771 RepID=A0A0S7WL71_UNCT6|nr:MAG: hypothetical protein AMJ40_01560 [candidate division TA06 bacterium DG_26]